MQSSFKTSITMSMAATNTYDKYGYKTAYTDYNGDATRYIYDEYYDLDKVIYANDTTTDYTYDKNRMLVQVNFSSPKLDMGQTPVSIIKSSTGINSKQGRGTKVCLGSNKRKNSNFVVRIHHLKTGFVSANRSQLKSGITHQSLFVIVQ